MWDDLDLPNDTKKTLNTLIDRKKKMDAYERRAYIYAFISGIALLAAMVYFSKVILMPSGTDMFRVLSRLLSTRLLYFIILISVLMFKVHEYARKYKKMKEKYDNLRAETVNRLKSTWFTSGRSEIRDAISNRMAKEGVNISFASK